MKAVFVSDDYNRTEEIATCRFWMMCKMRYAGIFNKKYELYLGSVEKDLLKLNPSRTLVKQELEALQMSSYNSIPAEFFNTKDYKNITVRTKIKKEWNS